LLSRIYKTAKTAVVHIFENNQKERSAHISKEAFLCFVIQSTYCLEKAMEKEYKAQINPQIM